MAAAIFVVLAAAAAAAFWPRDPTIQRQKAYDRGLAYANAGKYREAIIEYRNALKADPRYGKAHYALANAFVQVDDASGAFQEYVLAGELLPDSIDAQLHAGSALLLMGYAKMAGERADRVLKRDPNNVDAKILKANADAGLKNLDDAVAQLYSIADSASAKPADQARALLHLGVMELARGHRDDAEGILRRATALEPASATNHIALANYYWAMNRRDKAETELQRVLAIDAHEPRANRALAALYMTTGRMADAERPLKALAESSPEPSARFVLADYYIVANRVADAIPILNKLTGDIATYAQAQLRLSLIRYLAGDAAGAERIVDATLEREPTHPRVLLMKARLLAAARKYGEAIARAEDSLTTEKSAEAYYLLGTIHIERNESSAAIEAFNQVIKLRPTLVDALVALTALHLARNDVDTAARFASQAVANGPQSATAHLALGRALLARGDLDGAERELKPLADANADSAEMQTEWGRLLVAKQDDTAARRAFEKAMALDPALAGPLTQLVGLDIRTGRAAEIGPAVEARLAAKRDDPELLFLLARVAAATGDNAVVERSLSRIVEVDPSNLRAYGALGQFYYAADRLADARRAFQRLVAAHPDSVGAYTMLGMIGELDHQAGDAQTAYEHALAIDKNAAVAANNLACLYLKVGRNLDVALDLAQTAKAAFPDEPEFSDTLGWIYVQKDLPASAVEPLLESVKRVPDNPLFRYHLGVAYARAGESKMARAHLQLALRIKSDFDGAADARRTLADLPPDPPEKPASQPH
jgi:tetratricopeptide (TPR) repeat protein